MLFLIFSFVLLQTMTYCNVVLEWCTSNVKIVNKNKKLQKKFFIALLSWTLLGLVHTSDGIGSGVGIGSSKNVTIQCKTKRGIRSGVGSSTELESEGSEGSEGFLFLRIPLPLPSLPSYRFTLDQNFLPIPTKLTTPLPSLPSLVWTSP